MAGGIAFDKPITIITGANSSVTSVNVTNPYGTTLTDIQALYNQRVAAVLSSPTTYTNSGGYDDGYSTYVLNSRGWSLNIDYTAEGSWGFTPTNMTDMPRRDSGFSHSRMYYSGWGEPYYQIICRRQQDQYFNSLTMNWDENHLMGYMNIRALDSSYTYGFMFTIERTSYYLTELLYRTTATWTTSPVTYIGYKHYNRPTTAWSPLTVGAITDTYIRNTGITNLPITVATYPSPHTASDNSSILYYKYTTTPMGPIIPFVNKQLTSSKTFSTLDIHLDESSRYRYNYSFFVEGRTDDVLVQIKNMKDNSVYGTTLKENETCYVDYTMFTDYKITVPNDPNNYFKIIKPNDAIMIKGSITGTITLTGCTVNPANMYIICLRSDGIKIGEYNIDISNTYRIHNLNVNERYHIILVDKARTLEWMVSSYRKPLPYDELPEIDVPEIANAYVISDSVIKILKWTFKQELPDVEYKIDYCNIYYGNTLDSSNKLNMQTCIRVYGMSYELTTAYLDTYKYYVIETVYRNLKKQSGIITNDSVVNIAKFKSEYYD